MALAPPLVSVEDLSTFMRESLTGTKYDQAELVLQVVSAWTRTVGGKNWNSTDLLPPDDVVGVVLSAARRELNNPDRVISEDMGPLAVKYAPPPEGFFTKGERAILSRKSSGSLFTISTRREDSGWGDGYLHMREDLSDDPIPVTRYGEPDWNCTIHYP